MMVYLENEGGTYQREHVQQNEFMLVRQRAHMSSIRAKIGDVRVALSLYTSCADQP